MRMHGFGGSGRGHRGFGAGTLLRILARVFGLGFLVGGAMGVRTGIRAQRRQAQDQVSDGSDGPQATRASCSTDASLRQLRQRVRKAGDALFGPISDSAPEGSAGTGSEALDTGAPPNLDREPGA